MELDKILNASVTCLSLLENGRYRKLQHQVAEYTAMLEVYLRKVEIRSLTPRETSLLIRINENHKQTMELVEEQRHMVARQITKLQKGKRLSKAYGG